MTKRRQNKVRRKNTRGRNTRKSLSSHSGIDDFLILDRFSSRDIETWREIADGIDLYCHKLFSSLEAQRRAIYDDLCAALSESSNLRIPCGL